MTSSLIPSRKQKCLLKSRFCKMLGFESGSGLGKPRPTVPEVEQLFDLRRPDAPTPHALAKHRSVESAPAKGPDTVENPLASVRKIALEPILEKRGHSQWQTEHNITRPLRSGLTGGFDDRRYLLVIQSRNYRRYVNSYRYPGSRQPADCPQSCARRSRTRFHYAGQFGIEDLVMKPARVLPPNRILDLTPGLVGSQPATPKRGEDGLTGVGLDGGPKIPEKRESILEFYKYRIIVTLSKDQKNPNDASSTSTWTAS